MVANQSAQGLASLGRNGDSMLVHMSPHEVAGLQGLAMAQGGSLTINPDTGLPEAFNLFGFFSSFLPTIAGMMVPGAALGGMAPILAGAATGAGLAAAKKEDPLMGGILGGLGGYSGGKLGPAISAASTPTAATTLTPNTFGELAQRADLATKAAEQSAIQSGMQASANMPLDAGQKEILDNINATRSASTIPQIGMANTFGQTASAATLPQSTGEGILGGLKNIATGKPGAWEAYAAKIGPNPGLKLAMPVGGALLGGLESSDLYGDPLKPKEDKYDPYATLNLAGDTGLKLYATGGVVSNTPVGGGISGLYAQPDNSSIANISQDGYGIGRLSNLAQQQSLDQAKIYGYAMGGPVSFADGGDAMKEELPAVDQNMGLASIAPSTNPAASTQTMPAQAVQAAAATLSGTPDSGGSIIEQVTAKLQQDPNYKPQNPIEASIIKQLKGTDEQGQQQGLASLGPVQPSQPMAPSYNASQPIGPTYYAGMNAPRSYADGGYLDGQGDGMSDSIPATIEGQQPARLADGEFIVPADVVSHIGNGSSKAGSKRLYSMLDRVRKARTGTKKQGKQIKPEKYMPA